MVKILIDDDKAVGACSVGKVLRNLALVANVVKADGPLRVALKKIVCLGQALGHPVLRSVRLRKQ